MVRRLRLRRRPRLRLASWHPFPSRRTRFGQASERLATVDLEIQELRRGDRTAVAVAGVFHVGELLMDSPVVPSGTGFALPFAAGVQSSKFQFRNNAGKPLPPLPLLITIKATLGDGSLTATVTMIP